MSIEFNKPRQGSSPTFGSGVRAGHSSQSHGSSATGRTAADNLVKSSLSSKDWASMNGSLFQNKKVQLGGQVTSNRYSQAGGFGSATRTTQNSNYVSSGYWNQRADNHEINKYLLTGSVEYANTRAIGFTGGTWSAGMRAWNNQMQMQQAMMHELAPKETAFQKVAKWVGIGTAAAGTLAAGVKLWQAIFPSKEKKTLNELEQSVTNSRAELAEQINPQQQETDPLSTLEANALQNMQPMETIPLTNEAQLLADANTQEQFDAAKTKADKKLETISTQLASLDTSLPTEREKTADLKTKKDMSAQKVANLEKELEALEQKQKDYNEKSSKLGLLQIQLTKASDPVERADIQQQIDKLGPEVKALYDELSGVNIETKRQELTDAKTDAAAAKEAYENNINQIATLETEKTVLQEQQKEITEAMTAAEARVSASPSDE